MKSSNLLSTLSLSLIVALAPYSPAGALTGSQLVRQVQDRVVTIRVFSDSGEETGLGSGFLVAAGKVATNVHVIAGGAWAEILDRRGEVLGTAPYALALDEANDLAILPAPGFKGEGLPLASNEPDVGDPVWVFGAPLGLEGTVSNGVVAARREFENHALLQITAPVSPGSSGGPVISEQGEVVAVVVAYLRGGQNLNLAAPVAQLVALFEGPRGRIPFPEPEPSASDDENELDELELNIMAGLVFADSIPALGVHQGVLDANDPVVGTPMNFMKFQGREGQEVDITISSAEFDPIGDLMEMNTIAEGDFWNIHDDDSGEGYAARIQATLPATGLYYLMVSGYDGGQGTFQVAFGTGQNSLPRSGLNPRWVQVVSGGKGTFYVDSQTLQKTYAYTSCWVLTVYDEIQSFDDGDQYDSVMEKLRVDCDDQKIAKESYSYRLAGESVSSGDTPSLYLDWDHIIPGSIGEAIMEFCCRPR